MKKFLSAADTLIITVKSKVDGLKSKWTIHWDRDIPKSPFSQKLIQKPESRRLGSKDSIRITKKEPKFKFFDFGAFQNKMQITSHEKTSFTCFLGYFLLLPV